MSSNKTAETDVAVAEFIAGIADARRAEEAGTLDALYWRVTGEMPRMWGPSIIGYGSYHYRYASGREGDAARAGFSPRTAQLVLYLNGEWSERQAGADALFAGLGKHSLGVSCLYIKKLTDVDAGVLERLVALNWAAMNDAYPA